MGIKGNEWNEKQILSIEIFSLHIQEIKIYNDQYMGIIYLIDIKTCTCNVTNHLLQGKCYFPYHINWIPEWWFCQPVFVILVVDKEID